MPRLTEPERAREKLIVALGADVWHHGGMAAPEQFDSARNAGLVALVAGGIGWALTKNPILAALALAGGATAGGAHLLKPGMATAQPQLPPGPPGPPQLPPGPPTGPVTLAQARVIIQEARERARTMPDQRGFAAAELERLSYEPNVDPQGRAELFAAAMELRNPPGPPGPPMGQEIVAGDRVIVSPQAFPSARGFIPADATAVAVEVVGVESAQFFSGNIVGYWRAAPYGSLTLSRFNPIFAQYVPRNFFIGKYT